MIKPSILAVIGERAELRKSGREYIGLCPFHTEKTPSFNVNEEKGVFHCHGCQAGGDVFDFLMQIDGVSFLEAVRLLGVNSSQFPRREPVSREASIIANWCNYQTVKVQALLREVGDRMRLAKEVVWSEEVQLLISRQWEILNILADDLQDPKCAISLFDCRENIEFILQDVEPEPLPEFPELTPEYEQRLKSYVRGDA